MQFLRTFKFGGSCTHPFPTDVGMRVRTCGAKYHANITLICIYCRPCGAKSVKNRSTPRQISSHRFIHPIGATCRFCEATTKSKWPMSNLNTGVYAYPACKMKNKPQSSPRDCGLIGPPDRPSARAPAHPP